MDQSLFSGRGNSAEDQQKLLSNSLLSNSLLSATTPVPNALLDRVMPTLRDTELRVLLVVVRQTRGWQEGPHMSQRKERDWLTQSQLMSRTGRGSGAVAQAVEALIQTGLIEVQDRMERPLRTPAERRRHLGRLYYRLGSVEAKAAKSPATKSPVLKSMRKSIPKSAHAKSHTTKETENKINKNINKEPHKNVDNPVDNSLKHDSEKIKSQIRRQLIENPLVIRTNGWEHIARLRDRNF